MVLASFSNTFHVLGFPAEPEELGISSIINSNLLKRFNIAIF